MAVKVGFSWVIVASDIVLSDIVLSDIVGSAMVIVVEGYSVEIRRPL